MKTEPIELDTARDEWEERAARSGNIFATWEWCWTWWRHFGNGHRLVLRTVREAGELVAILPLYEHRAGPFRVLRFLGHGLGDQLGRFARQRIRRKWRLRYARP
jgi:CelD/BcsL family acetyltransferase involved in cellulose biosynthesis